MKRRKALIAVFLIMTALLSVFAVTASAEENDIAPIASYDPFDVSGIAPGHYKFTAGQVKPGTTQFAIVEVNACTNRVGTDWVQFSVYSSTTATNAITGLYISGSNLKLNYTTTATKGKTYYLRITAADYAKSNIAADGQWLA